MPSHYVVVNSHKRAELRLTNGSLLMTLESNVESAYIHSGTIIQINLIGGKVVFYKISDGGYGAVGPFVSL